MNVRPAGREACNCASPYNSILERLDAMEAEILAVQATADSAMGVANAQAGAAASSASAAAASATAAGNAAISAAADASDALTQATASAGSADDAADSAADALTALQTIEGTIASVLASDIGGKVDKLTTAGFYLYMHNGSTQGEVQPVVAPTAATIPIRDSDGRMQAADPASGATDKTLVTANWVSQTGDSAPNNLVHKSGNETIAGVKTYTDLIHGTTIGFRVSGQLVEDKWYEIAKTSMSGRRFFEIKVTLCSGTFDAYLQFECLGGYPTLKCRKLGTLTGYASSSIAFGTDSDGKKCLLIKGYDSRWVTRADIFQEYRNGSDGDFEAGAMAAMDDLTGYTGIVYGSDMS